MHKQSLVRYPEKRRGARAPFYSPILVEDLNAGYIYRARMVNYSKDGIFIETDVGLDPGEEIYIGIEDSPQKFSPDAARSYRAKVIWQKGLKNSNFNFGYGVIIVSGNDNNTSDELVTRNFQERKELRKHPRKSFPKTVYFTSQNQYYHGSIDNISRGGIFIETGTCKWRKNEYLEVEFIGCNGNGSIRLPAVVVHHSEQGVGLMFDAVTDEQRRVLRDLLFNRPEERPASTDAVASGPRAVA